MPRACYEGSVALYRRAEKLSTEDCALGVRDKAAALRWRSGIGLRGRPAPISVAT